MERVEAVVVCLLIIAMDAAAGVVGIKAEEAQDQGRHMKILFIECWQPVRQAYRLGLAAAALLASSHVIANLLGGCVCSGSMPNRQMASFALVLSWIVLVVGLAMLVVGVLQNGKAKVRCGVVPRRFLWYGGILCFVHGFFCLIYYVSANAAAREEARGSIGMARRM